MRSIKEMSFSEVVALPIPCEVIDQGIRKTATFRLHLGSSGHGMGESPATVYLVLSDGYVYEWGAWAEVDFARVSSYHGRQQKDMSF